jgi:hypothetical protein
LIYSFDANGNPINFQERIKPDISALSCVQNLHLIKVGGYKQMARFAEHLRLLLMLPSRCFGLEFGYFKIGS